MTAEYFLITSTLCSVAYFSFIVVLLDFHL